MAVAATGSMGGVKKASSLGGSFCGGGGGAAHELSAAYALKWGADRILSRLNARPYPDSANIIT